MTENQILIIFLVGILMFFSSIVVVPVCYWIFTQDTANIITSVYFFMSWMGIVYPFASGVADWFIN